MAIATALTAARMLEIEAASVVDGEVVGDELILTTHGGATINAGDVRGPAGSDATVPDASETVKGKAELATSAEVITGTDTTRIVTPAGLASLTASETRRGLIEISTSAEVLAGADGVRAVTPAGLAALTATTSRKGLIEIATPAEVAALTDPARAVTPETFGLLRPWLPLKPTGVGSSGATATLDSATGIVTLPANCTMVRIDGIFHNDYEVELYLDLQVDSGHATDNSAFLRMSEGGVINSISSYNTAGHYSQYNGVGGLYVIDGSSVGAAGAVSGGGSYVDFTCKLTFRAWALNSHATSKVYAYFVDSFSSGSARGVRAGGYTPSATVAFDGVALYFNGSLTGKARGKISGFRRKIR